jgi:hypothetical protein
MFLWGMGFGLVKVLAFGTVIISWAPYIFGPLRSSIVTLSTLSPPFFLHVLRPTLRADALQRDGYQIPCVQYLL